MRNVFKRVSDNSTILKQKLKINSLKNEVETLENAIKSELYKEFMKKLDESEKYEKMVKENKRLKSQNKTLKELLKEGK